MALRTFIAVDIDEETRRRVAAVAARIETAPAKVNWVAAPQLHVTVKFLGDVDEAVIPVVCEAAAETARRIEPFDFEVRGLLAVPPRGRLRMFWAGVEDPTGRMGELAAGLEDALGELGFPRERRRFRPHITVARVRSVRDRERLRAAVAPWREEPFGTPRADALTVYSSELTPQGPVYAPLARPALGGSRSDGCA